MIYLYNFKHAEGSQYLLEIVTATMLDYWWDCLMQFSKKTPKRWFRPTLKLVHCDFREDF